MEKRYFKFISLLFLIILLLMTNVGCGFKANSQGKLNDQSLLIVTDQMDRKITLSKLPERIISLAPSNTEIAFAIGLEDKLVGVTDYCDYPEEAKGKEKVGGFAEPNMEKILSLKPDLVLVTNMHQKAVEQLAKLGIPSVVLDPQDLDSMLESIEIIGKASGHEKESSKLVESLKSRIKAVEEKVPDTDRQLKIYYEVWPSPLTTAGPGTFVDDIITRAGGQNIASDAKKAYPQYSQETIVSKNPDIIIFSHHGSSNQSIDDILTRRGWENIQAIKNKKVYYVDENIVQRATPRLVDGLEEFVKIIHGED